MKIHYAYLFLLFLTINCKKVTSSEGSNQIDFIDSALNGLNSEKEETTATFDQTNVEEDSLPEVDLISLGSDLTNLNFVKDQIVSNASSNGYIIEEYGTPFLTGTNHITNDAYFNMYVHYRESYNSLRHSDSHNMRNTPKHMALINYVVSYAPTTIGYDGHIQSLMHLR